MKKPYLETTNFSEGFKTSSLKAQAYLDAETQYSIIQNTLLGKTLKCNVKFNQRDVFSVSNFPNIAAEFAIQPSFHVSKITEQILNCYRDWEKNFYGPPLQTQTIGWWRQCDTSVPQSFFGKKS